MRSCSEPLEIMVSLLVLTAENEKKFILTQSLLDIKLDIETLCIQVNLIIMLSLGSIETDRVISEPCYNEVIYYRHMAK